MLSRSLILLEEWFVRKHGKITLRVVTYLCDRYQDNVH